MPGHMNIKDLSHIVSLYEYKNYSVWGKEYLFFCEKRIRKIFLIIHSSRFYHSAGFRTDRLLLLKMIVLLRCSVSASLWSGGAYYNLSVNYCVI
jgi:hypothetical protein